MVVKDIMTHNVVSIDTGRAIDVKKPHQRPAGSRYEEIMTPDPYTVKEEDLLDHLVEEMQRRRIKRLPVMRDGQMVGIVSGTNLIAAAPWRISYIEHLVTRWPDR